MSGYPGLNGVTDPHTKTVLKKLFDENIALRARVEALEARVASTTTAINANGQRVTNVGDPNAETDAVTVKYLRQYVAARVGK